mgnify:CR=1 FL=1
MKSIVTLTVNPAVDISTAVSNVVPDRKLRCGAPIYEPGGGGINVSRVIARLGGRSLAVHTAGGHTGRFLRDLLDREGVPGRSVPVAEPTRESFMVYEETTGQQYRFGMPGPTLREEEWGRMIDVLSALEPRPDYLVGSGALAPGVPADFYARLARAGKTLGARVVVDTSGDALRHAVREPVYLVKPNYREFIDLVGREPRDESEQEALSLEFLRHSSCEAILLSLGAAGVLLATREGTQRLRAPVVPVRSKVGAGDSTVAGVVLSLAQGRPIRDAVLFGLAAGAAAVMTPGSELCRREDVERLHRLILSGAPTG